MDLSDESSWLEQLGIGRKKQDSAQEHTGYLPESPVTARSFVWHGLVSFSR